MASSTAHSLHVRARRLERIAPLLVASLLLGCTGSPGDDDGGSASSTTSGTTDTSTSAITEGSTATTASSTIETTASASSDSTTASSTDATTSATSDSTTASSTDSTTASSTDSTTASSTDATSDATSDATTDATTDATGTTGGGGLGFDPTDDGVQMCSDGFAQDPVEITSAAIKGDLLFLQLTYGGGCEDHEFGLCWDGLFAESNPVQVDMILGHESHDDPCDALVMEERIFDLTDLKKAWMDAYQQGSGTIIIHLAGYKSSVEYMF